MLWWIDCASAQIIISIDVQGQIVADALGRLKRLLQK
jgi:hypothetical protein